jgi:Outer membrane lipoprotein-sorting protein
MMRRSRAGHRGRVFGGSWACVVGGLAWMCLQSLAVAAAGPDAAAIMANADRLNRPAYETVRLRMELRGGDKAAERELVWRIVNNGTERTSLFKFTEPASLRGEGTLIIEGAGRPNAIWHYAPATRNVRRISGEHRQNRFMGTEFVFEDFEGLKLGRYAFTVVRREGCREASQCFVIEGTPRDPGENAGSGYGRKLFWIDEKTYAIVKIELHDLAGLPAKTFESSDFRQVAGYWRPRRQVMTNLHTGRSTVLVELQRTIEEPFDKYFVSQQYLRSE